MIVSDLVSMQAERNGVGTALVAGYGSERLSYAEWEGRSNGFAARLRQIGVKKGDRIALFLDNARAVEVYCAYVGVHKVGAVNVPVNTRLVGDELRYILEHSDAKVVITDREKSEALPPIVEHMMVIEEEFPVEPLESFEPDQLVSIDDDADYLYTSGTMGLPKGVIHTHDAALHLAVTGATSFPIHTEDVYQSAIPFYASSGCHTYLLPALFAGCTMIFDPDFDVEKTLETMEQEGTTVYFGVPAMLNMMLNSPAFRPERLKSLRLLLYGGSVMPYETIKKLREKLPGVELVNLYGLTEAGPGGTMLEDKYADEKIGAVGRPLPPFTEIRITDDYGDEVPWGEVGEIHIKAPSAMKGYHKDPDLTQETMNNGYISTGDLGQKDESGLIYIVDRKKDMVIRGGHNIYPVEVEQVLYQHPAVLETAVVGTPHDVLGEDLKAFVVKKDDAEVSQEELRVFVGERIANFKTPRDYEFIHTIPRNAMGKVLKRELRELCEAQETSGG